MNDPHSPGFRREAASGIRLAARVAVALVAIIVMWVLVKGIALLAYANAHPMQGPW